MLNIMSPTVKLQAVSAKKETSPATASKVSAVLPFPQSLTMDIFTPIATKPREGNNPNAKILQEEADRLAKIIQENTRNTDKNKSEKG